MGRRHLAGHDHLISADERARCGPVNAVGRITHDKVAPLGKLYVDQISRRRERSSGLCVTPMSRQIVRLLLLGNNWGISVYPPRSKVERLNKTVKSVQHFNILFK